MSRSDPTDELRDAIEALAGEQAADLVEDAWADARARVRRALTETMTETLLSESERALRPRRRVVERPPEQRPAEQPAEQVPVEPRPPERTPPEQAGEDELACYVYGVGVASEASYDAAGVDSRHEITLVTDRGLAAIVSPVSLSEFGEEPLHDNLNDIGWLEEKARAHEHVLDLALQQGPVVPMRLCTIYSTEEHVKEMLSQEREVFIDALERLEGKAEWGVKAIAEEGALERAAAQSSGAVPGDHDEPQGTAYMKRRQREAKVDEERDRVAEEWAQTVHERLAGRAAEALLNPLQRPEVSGHEGDMLLNGVYLVDEEEIGAFRATVDRLAEEFRGRGVSVELTGPWPPYNFVKSSIESAR
ncbi:MAG TPA: GvpL/GvpF family gas vesicle protein [Solirubrobacterales bacterium]|jgi:hypothetical protein|nr:GvpL/GvpF family gas vesicle protein [Solirubrobacterales bacterium]